MTDLPTDTQLASAAAQKRTEAKARFYATLEVAKRELTPKAVASRKARQMRDQAETQIRARPYAAAGTAAALALFLFRKPLAGLARRLLRKTRHD